MLYQDVTIIDSYWSLQCRRNAIGTGGVINIRLVDTQISGKMEKHNILLTTQLTDMFCFTTF